MNFAIHHLEQRQSIDPTGLLTGPLRLIEIAVVDPGADLELTADQTEHTIFVLSGSGAAESSGTTVPFGPGTALTLPIGTRAVLSAGAAPLEVFHAELTVVQASS